VDRLLETDFCRAGNGCAREQYSPTSAELTAERAAEGAGELQPDHVKSTAVPRVNSTALTAVPASIFLGVFGVIFGIVALHQIRRTGQRGARLAIVAIVIGMLSTAAGLMTLGRIWDYY
jgi:hypothetical protein